MLFQREREYASGVSKATVEIVPTSESVLPAAKSSTRIADSNLLETSGG